MLEYGAISWGVQNILALTVDCLEGLVLPIDIASSRIMDIVAPVKREFVPFTHQPAEDRMRNSQRKKKIVRANEITLREIVNREFIVTHM